jgi:trigger factor
MAKDRAQAAHRDRNFTVTVSSPGECKRMLALEIPWEEMVEEEKLVTAELRHDLKVPGFRKGKVPLKYIEKNYKEAIRSDAVRNLLPSIYEEALVREGITPIGDPRFENVKTDEGQPITMDVTVEIRPEPKIDGYRGIKVKVEKKTIEDKNVDEALEHIREQMATLKVVDRPVKPDDYVLVDYGPIGDDGEVDKQRLAVNYPIDLAKGNLLKEFNEGLLGMGTGDVKDIRVDYPEDFPDKDNAGQSKTFRVTVKEIKEKDLPEFNDEFAAGLGGNFETLGDLRKHIEEDLTREEDKRVEHDAQEQIIDGLIKKNSFEVPDAMIENYLASVLEEDRKRRPEVPNEEERAKEIQEHFRDAAVRTIKKYFILEAIKKQENIEIGREEVESRINELVDQQSQQADEIRAYFRHPEHRRSLENEMLDRKVLAFLKENAEIKVA